MGRLRSFLVRLLGGTVLAPAPAPVGRRPLTSDQMRLLMANMAAGRARRGSDGLTPVTATPRVTDLEVVFAPLKPLRAQTEAKVPEMALDTAFFPELVDAYFNEGIGFFGYQALAQLSQRAEYRKMVEIISLDMTREWIKFTYDGDGDATDKLKTVEQAFKKLHVQDKFRQALELDGLFGRGHIHINFGDTDNVEELKTRLVVAKAKIKKGSLKRLTVVDPTWTYPGDYNTTDPLAAYFYVPENWYVMNKKVHETRLLTFISRPLPDILKSAYAFGGLSITQMGKPYVDNWLQMRQSVADLVQSFSVFSLKTDMSATLSGTDATWLQTRADLFNAGRRNNGLMMLNKGESAEDDGEELTNISVPLAGLSDLLSSAQEQMCFVAGIPLVKFLGVTPSGLNASSDGEVRVYYDTIHAEQERLLRPALEQLLKIVQLSELGDIDENIGIEFEPLWQLDEKAQSEVHKSEADVDMGYVNGGVLSPEEVRGKLSADKDGPWANLDVSDVPEDPQLELQQQDQEHAQKMGQMEFLAGQQGDEEDDGGFGQDERIRGSYNLHGLPIIVENPAGTKRRGVGLDGKPWECTVVADYGYIDGTWSAEGRRESMDVFVGPDRESHRVFVIDQRDALTGIFDEHKVVLGALDAAQAAQIYSDSYDTPERAAKMLMGVHEMTMPGFRRWLETGDLYRPVAEAA